MDIRAMRRQYIREGLSRSELDPDPFKQFESWFDQACDAKIDLPNAMSLSTLTPDGGPTLRTVLLKGFDQQGFIFFTNYKSDKALQIEVNELVALLFSWTGLERQIIIQGIASRVSAQESATYFSSRPRGSQLGAWASEQSRPIASRHSLEKNLQSISQHFGDDEIPCPEFWGGYRITPHRIEFWQGREDRLHDRFVYTQSNKQDWEIVRLQP